jgi:hypothetical protein
MKHQRIEVTITDGSAWLERLSPRQMIAVGDCLWSAKRKRLIQDMKDAEIDSENRMKSLEAHDSKRGLMSEIIGYAVTSHGSLEIIEGLPDNFEGTAEDAIRIALELIGTEISMGSDKESKKKK